MDMPAYRSYSERFARWCFAQPWYPEERDRAMDEFMAEGFDPSACMEDMEATAEILFTQWVLFDRPTTPHHATPLDLFIAQETQPNTDDRAVYEEFRKSWISGFLIQELRRGEGFHLRDIATGKDYDVRERSGTFTVAVGGLLFARALRFRDHYVLAAGYGYWKPEDATSIVYAFDRRRAVGKRFDRLTAPVLAHLFLQPPPQTPEDARALIMTTLDAILQTLGMTRWTATKIIAAMERASSPVDILRRVTEDLPLRTRRRHAQELSAALMGLWNAIHVPEDSTMAPGPRELAILEDLQRELAAQMQRDGVDDEAAYTALAERCTMAYLDTPQRELDDKTPREVIRTERKELGNPHPEPSWNHFMVHTEPAQETALRKQLSQAMDAYEHGAYAKALRIYKAMLAAGVDRAPEAWRIYGNAGGCAFMLGKLDLAEQYLHHALALNPRYRIAKNNMRLIEEVRSQRSAKRSRRRPV